jgi:quercetin dioxygenase-like cupin family protein
MRRRFEVLAGLLILMLPVQGYAQQQNTSDASMGISRAATRPITKGAGDRFTGAVQIEPVFDAHAPGRVSAGSVTFAPGARSFWHSHPLGQYLIVTAGLGWTQAEGGPIEEIRAGDVVWCPPNVRHWHGASATTAITHIAVQEAIDGSNVVWMEQVSDAQYAVGPAAVN